MEKIYHLICDRIKKILWCTKHMQSYYFFKFVYNQNVEVFIYIFFCYFVLNSSKINGVIVFIY